jgi:hypothetical protein
VTRSARLVNGGDASLTLTRALSLCLDLPDAGWDLITLPGAWARERSLCRRPLAGGHQGVSSRRGASSAQASPFMALARPEANQAQGEVIGATLIYSGNFIASAEATQYGAARLLLGAAAAALLANLLMNQLLFLLGADGRRPELLALCTEYARPLLSAAPLFMLNYLLYDLGIELSEYSELELLEAYNKHAEDARIANVVNDMAEELGTCGNKHPHMLPKFAQYELTVEDWIRGHKGSRKYVTMTSTCWPAFPVNFGFVPCYVNSRLTTKGVPVACEVDVYGAVSEYIGQCVSDDIVAILNLNNSVPQSVYDEKIKGKTFHGKQYKQSDLFIGYHCGTTSSKKLQSCSSELHFVNNLLIGEEKATGTIHGEIIPGAVTLFRLQGMRDGRLRAYVAQGQVLPVSMDTYGGRGIIAVPEYGRFLRNVVLEKQFPNHAAIVFGHYGEELVAILRQLGIEDIEYNHAANVPYEKENPFSDNREWF